MKSKSAEKKQLKILLFKTGAIGDTLMTTPLVRQLRENYPHAKIDYLIGKVASQTLEGNKNIDEIIRFDPDIFFKKRIFEYLRLVRDIKKRHYDIIFVLDKHIIFNFTAKLTGIPKRIGFDRLGREGKYLTDRIYYGNDKHEIYYYLDLLKGLKDPKITPDYKNNHTELFIDDKSSSFAQKFWKERNLENKGKDKNAKGIIAIAPGGGKNPGERTEYRNWPVEKYIELIKILVLKKKYTIILIGGKDDVEKSERIQSEMSGKNSKNIISLVGKCSLKESAAIMQRCKCVICNDTGTMHIAGAVNHHIISIFGPTRPDRKAPLWKESKSIWKDKDIYEKDYELFGKKSKESDKKFMKRIEVSDVIKCM
jgi:lipopolysaccharide heptosyltransferase II